MNTPTIRRQRQADLVATRPAADVLQRTRAPASWTRYMRRLQDETIHFTGAWLGRCLETAGRFSRSRTFADVIDTQARFVGDLLSDFVDEGAMIASALCETAPDSSAVPAEDHAGMRPRHASSPRV